MAKDKQGLHFTELVWESTEQNMAIPPRGSEDGADQPKPKAATAQKKAEKAAVQLQLWDMEESAEPVTTTESQFVQRARELADHKEPAALFVPFKSYWPTYGHMTGAQSRWYFFWRDEVRQGRYPKTDLSYIFLHTYELINGVGWVEPQDGYRQLNLLWEAYRDSYKRLDQYLGGWMADFSFVHKLDVSLAEIVARSRGLAGDLAELELVRCLSSAPEQLSIEALSVMSDYDISKSKFYTGEGKAAAERYIPQVVALIDAYVSRKHGSNLITMFPPGPPVMRERYLFRSAVYDISLYGYSVFVPVVRISKSPPLRSLVTRLFRLTENKLRALMGYRGRLKDIKVDADMDELITRFLEREFRKAEQEGKGPAVVIDPQKLERLENDSEVVRSLLTVEESVEPEDDAAAAAWSQLGAVAEIEELGGGREVHEVEPDSGGNPGERLSSMEDSVAEGAGAQAGDNEEVRAENLNIEEIGAEARNNEGIRAEAWNISEGKAEVEASLSAVDREADDWAIFASALSPLQREVVLALSGADGASKAGRLAAEAGTMAELLYDEINELAMESLGDLIIDGEELTEECILMLDYLKR